MNQTGESCKLNNAAKEYLCTYRRILEEMMHQMLEAGQSNSISDDFIKQMLPHRQGAVEMSKNILRYTTSAALQDMAVRIVEEQVRGMERMLLIQGMCGKRKNPREEICHFQQRMDHIMRTMFEAMGGAGADQDVNADYIREMLPHYRGSVEMCKNVLHYNLCAELVPVLKDLISSQEKELEQMQEFLNEILPPENSGSGGIPDDSGNWKRA